MPNDIYYGADVEARIGLMADAATDPTAWSYLVFKTLTLTPDRQRKQRPLIGRARNNAIDNIKPRDGMFKLNAELVVEADSLMLPLVLRHAFGAPATTGPATGIYTHVWSSGTKTPNYFALQVKTGSGEVRIYRGLTGASVSVDGKGDQVSDYDVQISLRGLSRAKETDFIGTTPAAAAPAESAAIRLIQKVAGTAASNLLQASWQWDRKLAEDAFLSSVAELSALRPDGGDVSGTCQVRAIAAAFDTLEEGSTDTAFALQYILAATGHDIVFEHPQAVIEAAPLPIDGPGLIERTFGWTAYQSGSVPAAKITVKNNVAAYT